MEVIFAWTDDTGEHTERQTMGEKPWVVPTGKAVRTRWVEMRAVKK